jgi:hypothetical protein|tara:strand:- start:24 stop:212 length:189 start_codon:yes stop_codon:yes gene_type:complete
MIEWLLTALGLVLILEGLAYSIFPRQMKSMIKKMLDYNDNTLILIGLPTALLGLFMIWVVRT